MYVTAHRTGRKGRSHRLPRPGRSLVSGTTRRAGDHHRAHHPMAGIIFMAGEWGVQFTRSITQVARRNPAFCPDRCLMRWENLSR